MGYWQKSDWKEKGEIEAKTEEGSSKFKIPKATGKDKNKKDVRNHQKPMKSNKMPTKTGRKQKLPGRMVSSLIRKARYGSYSAGELTSIAENYFKVDIRVWRVTPIIFDTAYVKYLKMLKAPWMLSENRKDIIERPLKYMKKDQEIWS